MNATQRDQAERVSKHARISYIAATQLLSAARQNNYRNLAIQTEKHLLNGTQMEALKEMGLTILDCITGDYESYDRPEVESILNEWNERLGEQVFNPVND